MKQKGINSIGSLEENIREIWKKSLKTAQIVKRDLAYIKSRMIGLTPLKS